LAGFPESHIAGTNLAQFVHPEDIQKLYDAINTSIRDKCIAQVRFRLIGSGDELHWVQGSCSPVQKDLTRPRFILISISDITSIVTAEEQTRSSAALLTSFLDNLPDPAWLKDEYGKYLAINKEMEKLHNIKRELIIGKMDE
jgi:PAS domain S-box-containing protein